MQSLELVENKLAPNESALEQSRLQNLIKALAAASHALRPSNETIAKRLVLHSLERMQRGELTLVDGSERYTLGGTSAGISAEINVHDPRAYSSITFNGVLGAAEAYMNGYWSTPCLLSVVQFMVQNMEDLQSMNQNKATLNRFVLSLLKRVSRNSLSGSKANIASHYDLGDDFFALFLDPDMMYSSAYFKSPNMALAEASSAKLQRVCEKLELSPNDHLLEIGTGWGGMAIYAATHFGCKVTTTTISQNQYEYASRRVKALGLQDLVTVLCKDYRDLEGQYDKLVSIEMIEAVGHQYYEEYFRQCSSLLKQNGLMLIQAITVPDQRYVLARDNVDFIKRYIFPGGCLPSMAVIANQTQSSTDMNITDVFDITRDYANTLAIWRERFNSKLDEVMAMGCDERFIKMWEYYLCYCEGGFRERVIGTYQILFAKPDYRPVQ